MGLNWNEFSKKRWTEIMNGRTETLTPEQVADFNKVRFDVSPIPLRVDRDPNCCSGNIP